jgi:hypothetical protein
LPVPTYQNEQLRDKVSKNSAQKNVLSEADVIDIDKLEINEKTPEVTTIFIH